MKNTILLFIILFFCSSMRCKKETENCHYFIKFNNSSSRDIYAKAFPSMDGTLTVNYYGVVRNQPQYYKFKSGGDGKGGSRFEAHDCYERELRSYPYQDEKIYVVVYDAAILENTDPKELERQGYSLKIYELTLSELRKLNWTIDFKD